MMFRTHRPSLIPFIKRLRIHKVIWFEGYKLEKHRMGRMRHVSNLSSIWNRALVYGASFTRLVLDRIVWYTQLSFDVCCLYVKIKKDLLTVVHEGKERYNTDLEYDGVLYIYGHNYSTGL